MKQHPKLLVSLMVIILLLSAGLSFTIFRKPEKTFQALSPPAISDGFDQISSTAAAIQKSIRLKHEIDSLSNQKSISPADSLRLGHDLDALRQIQTLQP